MKRDKKAWIGLLALVGFIAPLSNAANALTTTPANNLSSTKSLTVTADPKSAFLVLKQYQNADSLTDRDLIALLKAVGFKGKGLKTAWAVAKSESNGQPIRYNGNRKTGDSSYGLFQINMLGNLGPERRAKYGLDLNAELLSPVVNAKIVYEMTQGGTNWKAWKYASTPQVKRWLKKFPNQYL